MTHLGQLSIILVGFGFVHGENDIPREWNGKKRERKKARHGEAGKLRGPQIARHDDVRNFEYHFPFLIPLLSTPVHPPRGSRGEESKYGEVLGNEFGVPTTRGDKLAVSIIGAADRERQLQPVTSGKIIGPAERPSVAGR